MKNNLIKVFNTTFAIIFIYIIANVIFNNNNHVWTYEPKMAIIFTICYIIFFLLIYKLLHKKKKVNTNNIILLFIIVIFFQIIIGTAFQVEPAWDVEKIFKTSEEILNEENVDLDYLYTYKNNLAMEVIVLLITKISNIIKTNTYNLAMYVNILVIDSAVLFTYLCAKEIYGEGKALTVLLFLILMTPIYLFVPIIYTDTFTMLFPVMIYYLYSKSEKSDKKIKYYILISILLAIGYLIKPTVAIIIIAIIIMSILFNKIKDTILLLTTTLTFSLGIVIIFNLFVPKLIFKNWNNEEYNNKKLPIYNWIMMGLEDVGAYNDRDNEQITNINGYLPKKEYAKNIINERLNKIKNEIGLNKFVQGKLTYMWGEGTYFAQVALRIDPINRGIYHQYIIRRRKTYRCIQIL